jgi:hypothetical protein
VDVGQVVSSVDNSTAHLYAVITMDLDGPALAPPEGVTPNFDNPDNQNALARGVLATCAAIATICLLLRIYGRFYLLRKVSAEDGTCSHSVLCRTSTGHWLTRASTQSW